MIWYCHLSANAISSFIWVPEFRPKCQMYFWANWRPSRKKLEEISMQNSHDNKPYLSNVRSTSIGKIVSVHLFRSVSHWYELTYKVSSPWWSRCSLHSFLSQLQRPKIKNKRSSNSEIKVNHHNFVGFFSIQRWRCARCFNTTKAAATSAFLTLNEIKRKFLALETIIIIVAVAASLSPPPQHSPGHKIREINYHLVYQYLDIELPHRRSLIFCLS